MVMQIQILIAALKANVHPIRIVRHKKSIEQYGKNYFGNVLQMENQLKVHLKWMI